MSGVPTGAGNLPPGVTDNDPHFEGEDDLCDDCGAAPRIADEYGNDRWCIKCYDRRAERAHDERMEDGEAFRGGEAEAYYREQQARIKRECKS